MNLLFVANFDSDVGYAWHTIDAVYRRVGAARAVAGTRTYIAYPEIGAAQPADGATSLRFNYARTRHNIAALVAFLRLLYRHRIGILYLTDLENWSWRYPLYHLVGVRRIVVHDRTSGDRPRRRGLLGFAKRFLHQVPWLAADQFIGVSDFVAGRLVDVGAPPSRVRRVYNGIEVARFSGGPDGFLQSLLHVSATTRVVFASGRAQSYKGFDVLIAAAAQIERQGIPAVAFAYCGAGPDLERLRAEAAALGLRAFHFLGRREDVPRLLRSAAVAVVPSVWAEAFGLTVVEAMAAGVPVVASRVGGIPELVTDGVTGLLVPPGDPAALAAGIHRLLDDAELRGAIARAGSEVARSRFDIEQTVGSLAAILAAPRNAITRPS